MLSLQKRANALVLRLTCTARLGPRGSTRSCQRKRSRRWRVHHGHLLPVRSNGQRSGRKLSGTPIGSIVPMHDPYHTKMHIKPRLGPGVSLVVERQQQPQPSVQPQLPPPLRQATATVAAVAGPRRRRARLPQIRAPIRPAAAPQRRGTSLPTGQASYPMQQLPQIAIQTTILGPGRGTVGKPEELAAAAAPGSVPSRCEGVQAPQRPRQPKLHQRAPRSAAAEGAAGRSRSLRGRAQWRRPPPDRRAPRVGLLK